MYVSYLLFFFSLAVWGEAGVTVKVLPEPKGPADYDHEIKGCPMNSQCDQVMGLQMDRFTQLVDRLKEQKVDGTKKAEALEAFRAKYGIPVEFYTTVRSQETFKPIFYNSSCKNHNSKDAREKILRGTAFVKAMDKDRAILWRDQAETEVKLGDLLHPQKVKVYLPQGEATYHLPLGDQPLFIKDKDLYVLKEEDSFFYVLKVGQAGDWRITHLDFTRLSDWENKRENVACPAEKVKAPAHPFETQFCKSVWNEDLKQTVVVKMQQGCAI